MAATLRESVHSENHRPVIIVEGDTYPIRQYLGRKSGGLGFTWYGRKKMWWMYKDRFGPRILDGLNRLGVDTSAISGGQSSSPGMPPEATPAQPEKETPELTNKKDFDTRRGYEKVPSPRYQGFPIKENIYQTNVELTIDGRQYPFALIMDRWYVKGRRKHPKYRYRIVYEGKPLGPLSEDAPSQWGTYNEDQLALDLPQKVQSRFDIGDQSKLYRAFKIVQNLAARDPELVQYLEELSESRTSTLDNSQTPFKRAIQLPNFEGDFPVCFVIAHGGSHFFVYACVDHELSPKGGKLLGIMDLPPETRTFNEFNGLTDAYLVENHDELAEKYVEYLGSFPYSAESVEQSKQEMMEIIEMVERGTPDIGVLKQELISRGYIRPSKRGPKGPGMTLDDVTHWVIESKRAVNDAYSVSNNPDSFYGLIAYALHRKVRNITSFTEMMLTESIWRWAKLAQRYGHDLDARAFDKYIDSAVIGLYRAFFKKEAPKSRTEQFEEFYSGGWQGSGQGPGVATAPSPGALDAFVQYVAGLGYDAQVAKTNPRKAYRELAMIYHPDVGDLADEKIFGDLSQKYNALPMEIRADNWYVKMILAA